MGEEATEPAVVECLRALLDAMTRLAAAVGHPAEPAVVLLTAEELAERFRLSARTIKDQASAGLIPHHRFGKHYRFSMDDIDEILRQSKQTARVRSRRAGLSRAA
jgi:excisionase family DNA binding protein